MLSDCEAVSLMGIVGAGLRRAPDDLRRGDRLGRSRAASLSPLQVVRVLAQPAAWTNTGGVGDRVVFADPSARGSRDCVHADTCSRTRTRRGPKRQPVAKLLVGSASRTNLTAQDGEPGTRSPGNHTGVHEDTAARGTAIT